MRSPLAGPVGEAPEVQLSVPEPLVESTWPDEPAVLGSSQINDDVRLSGAFKETEVVESLLLSTSLFAVVLLPRMVTLPDTVWAPEFIVLDVLIVVEPPILEAPLIVAPASVLLVKVAIAASVTTTPVAGKVASEVMPVPPLARGRMPPTDADFDKSMAPNDGCPPALGTRRI